MISSCMDNRARLASHQRELSLRTAADWKDNQVDIYNLDETDMVKLWVANEKDRGETKEEIATRFEALVDGVSLSLHDHTVEVVSLYGATAVNAAREGRVLTALGRDMHRSGNIWGSFDIRLQNGRRYIVFKGNHRLRSIIRGTRYTFTNPTIVKMGIGTDGLKSAARGGAYVIIIVSTTVNSYEWIFNDDYGWDRFLYNVSGDIVKGAIALALGIVAAKKIAAYTGMAVVGNTLGIFVGLFFSFGTARITWSDISDFASSTVNSYVQAVMHLSEPSSFLQDQRRKLFDFGYCAADATGTIVIESLQREVQNRIQQTLNRLSPFYIR